MTDPDPSDLPWWLWPNVLALDAPAVAVVWQRFLAAAFGVPVPAVASVVLGFVVWAVYLADRLLDARGGTAAQPRHRFAARRPRMVGGMALGSLFAAAALAVFLPTSYLTAGAVVAVCVAAYLIGVHVLKPSRTGVKELSVGVIFAAGVAVPLIASEVAPRAWVAAVAGFGLACWLNCRLIDRWEAGAGGGGLLLAGAAVLCATSGPPPVGFAIAAAAGLLVTLDAAGHRTGVRLARVLADAALLTPLAFAC